MTKKTARKNNRQETKKVCRRFHGSCALLAPRHQEGNEDDDCTVDEDEEDGEDEDEDWGGEWDDSDGEADYKPDVGSDEEVGCRHLPAHTIVWILCMLGRGSRRSGRR
jgi:hypothetical protein